MPYIEKIPGYTRDIGKPVNWDEATQGPCASLPVRDVVVDGTPFMLSLWKFTKEELALLNAGHGLALGVSGERHPVVFMGLGDLPELETRADYVARQKAAQAEQGIAVEPQPFTLQIRDDGLSPRPDLPKTFTWTPTVHQRGAVGRIFPGMTLEEVHAAGGATWPQLAAVLEARDFRFMPTLQAVMVCLRISPQPGFVL